MHAESMSYPQPKFNTGLCSHYNIEKFNFQKTELVLSLIGASVLWTGSGVDRRIIGGVRNLDFPTKI